jgi:hypothetical protein
VPEVSLEVGDNVIYSPDSDTHHRAKVIKVLGMIGISFRTSGPGSSIPVAWTLGRGHIHESHTRLRFIISSPAGRASGRTRPATST